MVSINILIIEDENIIALDIERRLIQAGYNVVATANCSEEALQAVVKFQPDLILMDICIQGKRDGIETAILIQEQFQVPIIYLTAHTDENTLRRAKSTQSFGYVLKPFRDTELTNAIEASRSHDLTENRIK